MTLVSSLAVILRRRRVLLALAAGFAALAVTATVFSPRVAVPAPSAGAASGPLVVELFTSQGCSSCPPADALLGELAKRDDLLPLAFHIDYWDGLGWKDPFSLSEATARQRDYARAMGKGQIYTPQMIVGGTRDVIGSDRAAVARAIAEVPRGSVPVAMSVTDGNLAIRVGGGIGEGKLWLVSFDPRHETQVRAGENAGRKLVNANIVRRIEALGEWRGAALDLRRAVPVAGRGAALLLQAPDGRILGAAMARIAG
jgi:hypothetical protein